MTVRLLVAALALSLASVTDATPAVPARVAPTAPAQRASAAEALAFVKAYSPSELRREAELRILRETFLDTLRRESNSKAMLEAFPELGPELIMAMESQLDLYMREYDDLFFPKAAKLAREEFSRDDILALTAFYHSPLGQKAQTISSQKVSGGEVAEASLKGKAIDQGIMDRQLTQAGWAVLGGLTPDERTQFIAFMQSPLGQRFIAVQPKLGVIALEAMNAPKPAFEKASDAAMAAAFKQVTGIDVADQKK